MSQTSRPSGDAAGMLSLLGPEFIVNPYPTYAALHAAGSITRVPGLFGIGAWLVASHAACSTVLRSRQFGKEGNKVLPPEVLSRIPQESLELADRRRSNMLFRDPPDHTRLRGLVNQAFTPRTVEQLRPHIAEIAEQLIADMQRRGHGDLISDFAFPLPIIVIAELLGVPPADRDQFKAWSSVLTLGLDPTATKEDLERVQATIDLINDYLRDVIAERRRAPRNDLISGLVRVQDQNDKLTDEELISTCRLLLTAGHETTVNLIGNGMVALLRSPGPRQLLAGDPSLLPGAVEELLRYDSPVQMTVRIAYEDAELGAHTVKRGDLVVLLLGAANHDPAQFTSPGELDLRRENAHSHLSFGLGIHYCLGAPLARLEGQLAIGALLSRLPQLALPAEPLSWRRHLVLRGVQSLPVSV